MTAYRTPAPMPLALVPVENCPPPAVTHCPICGTNIRRVVCDAGHVTSGSFETICNRSMCSVSASRRWLGSYCGPDHRFRFGFLWLRRCQIPGEHIHQRCMTCGWRRASSPLKQGG